MNIHTEKTAGACRELRLENEISQFRWYENIDGMGRILSQLFQNRDNIWNRQKLSIVYLTDREAVQPARYVYIERLYPKRPW